MALLHDSLYLPLHQLAHAHFQRAGDFIQLRDADVKLPALGVADVIAVYPGEVGQDFLAPATPGAQHADASPKSAGEYAGIYFLVGHGLLLIIA